MQTRTFSALRANPIQFGFVTVRVGSKDGPLATGLKKEDGSDLSNPFPIPKNGRPVFQAPNGNYWLNLVGPGFNLWEEAQFLDVADVLAVGDAKEAAEAAAESAAESAAEAAAEAEGKVLQFKEQELGYFTHLIGDGDSLVSFLEGGGSVDIGYVARVNAVDDSAEVIPSDWKCTDIDGELPGGATPGELYEGKLYVENGSGGYYVFEIVGDESVDEDTGEVRTLTERLISSIGSLGASLVAFVQYGTGAVKRLLRDKLGERVSVEDFGAVGDGVTDDTPAFQKAVDYVSSTILGGTVHFHRRHLIDSNLYVKDGVWLKGPLGHPGEILPATSAAYQALSGALIVNEDATLTTRDSSAITNAIIIKKGLDLPFNNAEQAADGVLNFAGKAITVGGADGFFSHLLILGFDYAIYSSGYERVRTEWVCGDCNNGIHVINCYDVAYQKNCHFWPWTTTHQTWTLETVSPYFEEPGSLLTRPGTAYLYQAVADGNKITDCFSYGYKNGFVVDDGNSISLIGCLADYRGDAASARQPSGFVIKGTSKHVQLVGCQAWAQYIGVHCDIEGSLSPSLSINGGSYFSSRRSNVYVERGRAYINSVMFRANDPVTNPIGIEVEEDSGGITATNNEFDSIPTPISISGAALRRSVIRHNRYANCTDNIGEVETTLNTNRRTTVYVTGTNDGHIYRVRQARGTVSSPTASSANDPTINIRGECWDGNDTYRLIGGLRLQTQGNVSDTSSPGLWVISTTAVGSTSVTDRIRVSAGGNLQPITDNAYDLGGSGNRWANVWAANGTIQTSDIRTKSDIEDSSLGLDFIMALRPVSYRFVVGGNEVVRQIYRDENGKEVQATDEGAIPAEIVTTEKPGMRTHWGLIAQEVKEVVESFGVDFGGWLLENKDDPDSMQALRYEEFIAPLIRAVQELTVRVQELEAQIESNAGHD